MSSVARVGMSTTRRILESIRRAINTVGPVIENGNAKRRSMPKPPRIRQAKPEILVITRRRVRRFGQYSIRVSSQYLPEGLAVAGVVLVVLATWIIHPIAGLYVAGGAGLGAAWLIALGRRP